MPQQQAVARRGEGVEMKHSRRLWRRHLLQGAIPERHLFRLSARLPGRPRPVVAAMSEAARFAAG